MKLVSTTFFSDDSQLSEIKTYHVGALESAAHRNLRQYKDRLLKPYGLTSMEWYMLGVVHDAGKAGIRSTDLATKLGTTMGFVTKTINLLVAKDILVRQSNQKDGRSTYVTLNPAYQPKIEEIELMLRQELRKAIYSKITPEELRIYIKTLSQFTSLDK